MYESKYSKYITRNDSRYATKEEIKRSCAVISSTFPPEGCGVPLLWDRSLLYVDDSDTHYYIQGQTGSKKSRVVGTNLVYSIIQKGENAIINDPKGEFYRRTAGNAKKEGYNVKVLNLRDPKNSDGWNPMDIIYQLYQSGDIDASEQYTSDLISAVISRVREKTADYFWPDNASYLLAFCIDLLKLTVPKEYFNFASVTQFANEANIERLRWVLRDMDQMTNTAMNMRAILDISAEKTLSCIYATLKQALQPITQNPTFVDFISRNDISFNDLVDKKTIIYVIYPDEKTSLNFLISLFMTQCYQYLVSYSAKLPKARLVRRVNFVLDEFSNLPAVENFENRISEARGHNIRYFLFSQSYSQLKNRYKENADTIISNCDWIIFPSKEYDFLSRVSSICGAEYDFYGVKQELVSVSELQHLKKFDDSAEVLVLKSGQYPFISKLPDFAYTPVFEKCDDSYYTEIRTESSVKVITFDEWYKGLHITYDHPILHTKKSNQS